MHCRGCASSLVAYKTNFKARAVPWSISKMRAIPPLDFGLVIVKISTLCHADSFSPAQRNLMMVVCTTLSCCEQPTQSARINHIVPKIQWLMMTTLAMNKSFFFLVVASLSSRILVNCSTISYGERPSLKKNP